MRHVDDVGSVGIASDRKRMPHAKDGSDILHGFIRGRCGEGKDLVRPEPADGMGEVAVGGSEILSPFADHMGFVHHEKAYLPPGKTVQHRIASDRFRRGLNGGDLPLARNG